MKIEIKLSPLNGTLPPMPRQVVFGGNAPGVGTTLILPPAAIPSSGLPCPKVFFGLGEDCASTKVIGVGEVVCIRAIAIGVLGGSTPLYGPVATGISYSDDGNSFCKVFPSGIIQEAYCPEDSECFTPITPIDFVPDDEGYIIRMGDVFTLHVHAEGGLLGADYSIGFWGLSESGWEQFGGMATMDLPYSGGVYSWECEEDIPDGYFSEVVFGITSGMNAEGETFPTYGPWSLLVTLDCPSVCPEPYEGEVAPYTVSYQIVTVEEYTDGSDPTIDENGCFTSGKGGVWDVIPTVVCNGVETRSDPLRIEVVGGE